MNDKRSPILNNKTITLSTFQNINNKYDFEIISLVDMGGSIICYKAKREDGVLGLLKEYYPDEETPLQRDEKDNNLIPMKGFEDYLEFFNDNKENYIKQYLDLQNIKTNDTTHELERFIQEFRIYHGYDKSNNCKKGTAYIWTSKAELVTLDKYITNHRKKYAKNSIHYLTVLCNAVRSLSECINLMHKNGMLHRDIKPKNFGFFKRGNELILDTIKLFDLDSALHSSMSCGADKIISSKGFTEPEINDKNYNPCCQTDIFSIGATLYYAIIDAGIPKDGNFTYPIVEDDYIEDFLKQKINDSSLFKNLNHSKKELVINEITFLLKKCLSTRINRFENCDQILYCLSCILFLLLPKDLTNKTFDGHTWKLAEAEKINSESQKKILKNAVLYHLYSDPLYLYSKKSINLLCFGLQDYGSYFLDKALELGQMKDKDLNVFVVVRGPKEKEKYLKGKPELINFFNIDGSLDNSQEDIYGNIYFCSYDYKKLSRSVENSADEVLKLFFDKFKNYPNYVYTSVGSTMENYRLGTIFFHRICSTENFEDKPNVNCVVKYSAEYSYTLKTDDNVKPILVKSEYQSLTDEDLIIEKNIKSEIERMAFNAHLVWNSNYNLPLDVLKSEFKQPYNYESCVSNVLSIKYKLYSLGIDIDSEKYNGDDRLEKIIKEFYIEINSKPVGYKEKSTNSLRDLKRLYGKNDILDTLMYVEHKRWVVEKIVNGWQPMSIEDAAIHGPKDSKNKKHVCIVRSRPEVYFSYPIIKKEWNIKNSYSIDDLDNVSIKLHNEYKKLVNRKKNIGNYLIEELEQTFQYIKDKRILRDFEVFIQHCIKIYEGDVKYVFSINSECELIKSKIIDAHKANSSAQADDVVNNLNTFMDNFCIYCKALEYKDFKLLDIDLINSIPFIIWNNRDSLLLQELHIKTIPFSDLDYQHDPRFANKKDHLCTNSIYDAIYNSAVIRPRFIYFIIVNNSNDIEKKYYIECFNRIFDYFHSINYYPKIRFRISNHNIEFTKKEKKKFQVIIYKNTDAMNQSIIDTVSFYASDSCKNSVYISSQYISKNLINYNFSKYTNLTKVSNANDINFISTVYRDNFTNFTLNINSVVKLAGAEIRKLDVSVDSSVEFNRFWKAYTKSNIPNGGLIMLCDALNSINDELLVRFSVKCMKHSKGIRTEYSALFDRSCYYAFSQIKNRLAVEGLLSRESKIIFESYSSIRVTFVNYCCDDAAVEVFIESSKNLMGMPTFMFAMNLVRVEYNYPFIDIKKTLIRHNKLKFNKDMYSGRNFNKDLENLKSLLSLLDDKGLIKNYSSSNTLYKKNNCNYLDFYTTFQFTTKTNAELFSLAGKMFEAVVFNALSNYYYNGMRFDEVVTSFEIKWIRGGSNEIDCMICKGSKLCLVECKDYKTPIDDKINFFCNKIKCISNRFGHLAIPVLIVNGEVNQKFDDKIINGTHVISYVKHKNTFADIIYKLMTK